MTGGPFSDSGPTQELTASVLLPIGILLSEYEVYHEAQWPRVIDGSVSMWEAPARITVRTTMICKIRGGTESGSRLGLKLYDTAAAA